QRHAREIAHLERTALLEAIELLFVGIEGGGEVVVADVVRGAGQADAKGGRPAVVAYAPVDSFVLAIGRTSNQAAVEVDIAPEPEMGGESCQQQRWQD